MIVLLVLAVSASSAYGVYQYDPYTGQYAIQKTDPGLFSDLLSLPGLIFGNIWNLITFLFQTLPLSIAYIFSSIQTFFGFIEGKPTFMNFYQGYKASPMYWG